jgi:flagellar protein FliS
MAYEGILRFLYKAKAHIENGEIEEKYESLGRARDIVQELACTLNMEQGGQIAQNLWNLYAVFMKKIGEANITGQSSYIDEIIPPIENLRDAWRDLEIPEEDVRARNLNRKIPAAQDSHRVSITG